MYRPATRNPLPGLRGYRRGLGDDGTTPVDIGTSATVTVTPSSTTISPTGGTPITVPTATGTGSLTDWLNANSSTVLWVGGIAIGLLLLSKMTR